jgi:hypothetical protein
MKIRNKRKKAMDKDHPKRTEPRQEEKLQVTMRIDSTKYQALRHQLLDRRESFSKFVNRLIDEHLNEN